MNELALFAKYWAPGQVKTRLATCVGDEIASALYREFVIALVRRLQYCGDRRTVVYAPEAAAPQFRTLVGSALGGDAAQTTGDLGTRLQRDVQHALQSGSTAIVILGSDSPTVPVAYVEQAFSALRDHDVVLGPSEDGGYYLIGLRQTLPFLFQGIDWSSSHVWQQTLDRVRSLGTACRFWRLPIWYDVDTAEDLARLMRELAEIAEDDQELTSLREHIERTLAS